MSSRPKRIAIAGGTGLVGRHTAAALESVGHEPVILARSAGVDLVTGEGLDARLDGVGAVVDVLNSTAADPDETRAFFAATSRNLLAAEQRAGVGHHVLLSIVGVDRVAGNAHYEGKREQERIVSDGPVPFTILRATQFFQFAEMVAGWTTRDGAATIAPLLVQPVAVADVAATLAELSAGRPQQAIIDLAGPEPHDLVDMARRTLAARGRALKLIPSWRDGPFGVEMAGEVLLPGPEARIGSATFDAWLEEIGPGRA